MYIEVTVDLKNYSGETFDLRLSNFHTAKKVIDIVWRTKEITSPPREGHWIRVSNKQLMLSGNQKLMESGVTTGDRFEIL